jgi:peptidoglycan/LPS O-acetylase OafA/YrhL
VLRRGADQGSTHRGATSSSHPSARDDIPSVFVTSVEETTGTGRMPVTSIGPRLRHVAALDGLRGAAVAGVLLFHGQHLTGGYLGVDLFFVLSGFLITSLLLSEGTDTGGVRLGSFWARRARRLLPALGGLMVGIAIFYVVWAQPNELARIRGDVVGTLGYFANWRGVFSQHDYWAIFATPSPLDHTWSLAIEEQFYLIWPLVFVALLHRFRDRIAAAVLVTASVLAVVSTALMLALYSPTDSVRVYYGTDTRATGILLGAGLAAWFAMRGPARTPRSRAAVEAVGLAGIAVLAVMWTQLGGTETTLYRGGFVVAGLAAIAVIAAAWQPEPRVVGRILSFHPLCLLGLISYGVYLWHWPVDLVLTESRVGVGGWPLFFVQCAVTIAIAIASYQLLEMPIRRGALSKRQWQVVVPVLAVFAAGALFVASALSPSSAATFRLAMWQDPPRVHPISTDVTARVGRVIIIGDSVALSMASGLRNAGLDTFPSGYPGCRVIEGSIKITGFNATFGNCDWPTFWPSQIAKANPRVVIMATGGFELYDVRPPGAPKFLVPGTPAWARYFHSELQKAVDVLTGGGRFLVVTNYPCAQAPERAPRAFAHTGLFNDPRRKAANKVLDQVAAENPDRVRLLDLDGFLCPTGVYQSGHARVDPMRIDGVHFSRRGSDLVGRWIARQLLRDPVIGAVSATPVIPAPASPTAPPPTGASPAAAPSG